MKKQRVSALLELETIEHLTKEAKEKSISVSAVIRQKVEASYKLQEVKWPIGDTILIQRENKTDKYDRF